MKRLKYISAASLAMTAIAVIIAAFNLVSLYGHEKDMTMRTVGECADNAVVLEMVSRMESSLVASQSFIRLNAFMELSQQKDGRVGRSDSVRTSLAGLLRFGLEFSDGNTKADFHILDSIFRKELLRHGLRPAVACICPVGTIVSDSAGLWRTEYRLTPSREPEYAVYVSPMPGRVLSRMWGIVVPFMAVIAVMGFLSFYLAGIIRRMRTLEQMKDDFTHNMTHELKTPVAVAYSAADSMLRYYDRSDEERDRRFLNIIMERLSHLSGMIENILSMSMQRFRTMSLDIESVALRPVVEEVTRMMELKAAKPVDIDIDIPDGLTVRADAVHLGNMVANLVDNAIKYSNEAVRISIKADGHGLSVADDGIGMEKDVIPYIFDKFYRVPSGDRYETGGYGLGLYYVRQMAGLLGWHVDVASRPGEGTVFTINFNSDEKG